MKRAASARSTSGSQRGVQDLAATFLSRTGPGADGALTGLAVLAVSQHGGSVDLLAWPLLGSATTVAECQEGSHLDGDYPTIDCSSAPTWLQALPAASPGKRTGSADKHVSWVPLCWLPATSATSMATLLCGMHAGAISAWAVQLGAGALAPAQQEVSASSSVDAASTSGRWQRSAEPGHGSGSWRSDAAILVQPCGMKMPSMHSRMLFSLSASSASTAPTPEASDAVGAAPPAEGGRPAEGAWLWTTSLDRKVVAWHVSGGSATGGSIVLQPRAEWLCTGAPVTSLAVSPVCSLASLLGPWLVDGDL